MPVHVGSIDARQYAERAGHSRNDLLRGLITQAPCDIRLRIAAQRLYYALAGPALRVDQGLYLATDRNAALHGDAVNETACHRRCNQGADVSTACGRTEQEHPRRIATECRNIALDPLQHRDLIETAVIARNLFGALGIECGMS